VADVIMALLALAGHKPTLLRLLAAITSERPSGAGAGLE